MTAPRDPFDETLLSAYLDNELTSTERTAVEEHLKSSADLRKLLEELQSIRAMVRHLHEQAPRRSFVDGPWNSSSNDEGTSSELTQPKPLSVSIAAKNQEHSWSWQQLASLAAMLVVALGIGSLWFASWSRRTSGNLGYVPENQSKPADQGRSDENVSDKKAGTERMQVETLELKAKSPLPAAPAGPDAMLPPSNLSMPPSQPPAPVDPEQITLQRNETVGPREAPSQARGADKENQSRGLKTNLEFSLDNLIRDTSSSDALESWKPPVDSTWAFVPVQPDDSLKDSKESEGEPARPIVIRYVRRPPEQSNETNREPQEAQKLSERDASTSNQPMVIEGLPDEAMKIELESLGFGNAKNDSSVDETHFPESLVVEFQIPKHDWELGARELQRLGVQVPDTSPEESILDFEAVRTAPDRTAGGLSTDATFDSPTESMNRQNTDVYSYTPIQNTSESRRFYLKQKQESDKAKSKKSIPELGNKESNPEELIRVRIYVRRSQ